MTTGSRNENVRTERSWAMFDEPIVGRAWGYIAQAGALQAYL